MRALCYSAARSLTVCCSFIQGISARSRLPTQRPKGQALSRFIWWNGEIQLAEKQSVHYYANALHYGTAVFEGIRCYPTTNGTALFRIQEHMERLCGSAR